MIGQASTLRELHRLRRHAKNLKEEVDRFPRQVKAQQGKVTKQEDVLKQGQDKVKKLKVTIHDKETNLKAANDQIKKYEDQRNKATNKKEYDALQVEILHSKQNCTKLEEEVLNAILEMEEMAAQVPALEAAVKQAKDAVVKYEKDQQGRIGGLNEELQKTLVQITEVEVGISPELKPYYERMVTAQGEDAMSAVLDRNCTACYTSITAQNYNELIQGKTMPCKSCGRLLYLPEQAAEPAPAE